MASQREPIRPTLLPEVSLDACSDIDDRVDAAGQRRQLQDALARLSANDRDVLLLVAWEQLTPSGAAAVLNIRPSTARVRLHRARPQLRAELQRQPAACGIDTRETS